MSTLTEKIRHRPWLVALAVLALTALWVLSGLLFPKPRKVETAAPAERAEIIPEVQVMSLTAEPVTRSVTLFGRTEPARVVELRAETAGRVVAIGAARGAQVGAGAVLLQLEDGDRSARLAQARATLRQRELEYDGQLKLKPQGYISDAKLAESAALLETARTELRRAQLDSARATLRAPFAGALQDRVVEVGDYVSPGTVVATFVENRRLVVAASLSESQITGVKPGLEGKAVLGTGQSAQGRVRYVAPVADAKTRTFAVELEIANPRGELPAGVTAEISLPTGTVQAHRISPSLLSLDDSGAVGVKLLGANGRVRLQPAAVARSSPDGVWVTGLPNPAPVITGGQGYVRDGQLVRTTGVGPSTSLAASGPRRE